MGRTLHDAAGAFIGRAWRADGGGRQRAQQGAPVAPVEFGGDVEAAAVGVERIGLRDRRGAIAPDDAEPRAVRSALDDFDALDLAQFLAARRIVLFEVPGVPVARFVLRIDPELIAAPASASRPVGLWTRLSMEPSAPIVAPRYTFSMWWALTLRPGSGLSLARSRTQMERGGALSSLAIASPLASDSRSGRWESEGLTTTSAFSQLPAGNSARIAAIAVCFSAVPCAITLSSSASASS